MYREAMIFRMTDLLCRRSDIDVFSLGRNAHPHISADHGSTTDSRLRSADVMM
jgi:hypothetical protein